MSLPNRRPMVGLSTIIQQQQQRGAQMLPQPAALPQYQYAQAGVGQQRLMDRQQAQILDSGLQRASNASVSNRAARTSFYRIGGTCVESESLSFLLSGEF